MKINDFLKELLGEEVFSTVETKLNETKTKFIDLSEGQYIDKDKHTALKTQFDVITEKVKAFDGVDVDGLKTQVSQWEEKYNNDLNSIKMDYAIKGKLNDVKNQKAVRALLNMENVKLDGDSLTGIDEQLTALRESDPYLFNSNDKPPSRGAQQGSPTKTYNISDIQKMSTAEINANWGNADFQKALQQNNTK